MTPDAIVKMHNRFTSDGDGKGRCDCGLGLPNWAAFLEHSTREAEIHDPEDPAFFGCDRTDAHNHGGSPTVMRLANKIVAALLPTVDGSAAPTRSERALMAERVRAAIED